MAPCQHREEAAKSCQVADVPDRAHVAFEVRLDVGTEPQRAPGRTGQYLGIAAVKQADTIRLRQAERQQLQDGGAPGHRLAHPPHEGSFLGAGEQPFAHCARFPIDAGADVSQQIRRVLDLVEQHRDAQFLNERAGIGTRAGLHVRVFQQHVGGAREEPAQQGGLPGPARPGHHHRRETAGRLQYRRLDGSRHEAHMSILNYNFRFLKSSPAHFRAITSRRLSRARKNFTDSNFWNSFSRLRLLNNCCEALRSPCRLTCSVRKS